MTFRDRLVATIRAARPVFEAGEPDAPFLALVPFEAKAGTLR